MQVALKNKVQEFAPISLSDLDSVKLLNRQDTKFAFHRKDLDRFLDSISDTFSILEIKGDRVMTYESLYFDTEDFQLYLAHHNKRRNRFKIRFRKYVESDLCFFEIKKKNNKGRTIKKRIVVPDIPEQIEDEAKAFFLKEFDGQDIGLEQSIWINFNRFTLSDLSFSERATIDTNLHFKRGNEVQRFPNLVIAEIKQGSFNRSSSFIQALGDLHIRPFRVSKYCFGINAMLPKLKHNNFKQKHSIIKKIIA